MQQNRGGMGSHKHGTSGRAPKSPRFKHAMKRAAEATEITRRGGIADPAHSVSELMKRGKR